MKLTLSAKFEGIIWKVETDYLHAIIAVETRDIANRKTYFSAFNYESGELLFKEISVEDSWFWTIDCVYDGVILLHSYVNEGSPERKGIVALNSNGDIAWQFFHKTRLTVSSEGIIVYDSKIQPRRLELISAVDGTEIRSNLTDYQALERAILVPAQVDISNNIRNLFPENIVGPIYHREVAGKDLFVFHTQHENLFNQQITVVQHGKVILTDIMAGNIQKLNPEAFFIQQNHLFFIKNEKRELVSYSL